MSAQASDMSGWLLMGLPGAVYMGGLIQGWVAIGLTIGTFLNWILIAPRLRIYTEKTRTLTISSFIGRRFRDPTGVLRIFIYIHRIHGIIHTTFILSQLYGFQPLGLPSFWLPVCCAFIMPPLCERYVMVYLRLYDFFITIFLVVDSGKKGPDTGPLPHREF